MLANGDRRVRIDRGVIVAARHLHMSRDEAEGFGLSDGDVVALEVEGPSERSVLENLVVRSGPRPQAWRPTSTGTRPTPAA